MKNLRLILIVILLLFYKSILGQSPVFSPIELPAEINIINCIAVEDGKIIWVGTNKGLIRILDGNIQRIYSEEQPYLFKINEIAIDANGTKWLGNFNTSLIKYTNEKQYEEINLIKDSTADRQLITAINPYIQEVWVSTSEGLLFSYEKSTGKIKRFEGPDESNINSILIDEVKLKWISTPSGIYYSNDCRSWRGVEFFASSNYMYYLRGLYFATGRNDKQETILMTYEPNKRIWTPVEMIDLHDKFVKFGRIESDNEGNLYIGSNFGIYKYNIESKVITFYNQDTYKNFAINEVKSLAIQNSKTIWVASGGRKLFKIEF